MKIKSRVLIVLLICVVITILVCNTFHREAYIRSTGENVIYDLILAYRALDRGMADGALAPSADFTEAAILLAKVSALMSTEDAINYGFDSRRSFTGSFDYTSSFILNGGEIKNSVIRPAAMINNNMTNDEKAFYSHLRDLLKEELSRFIIVDEDTSIKYQNINSYSITNLATDFQEKSQVFEVNDGDARAMMVCNNENYSIVDAIPRLDLSPG